MSHVKCKAKLTDENQDKRIFPTEKVAFCDQIKAFPVANRED